MARFPSRYDHHHPLGRGGMGEVHRVHDRDRGEDVAMKVFAPAPGANVEEGRLLFQAEFRAMASLRHPNLVAAHDYGTLDDGTPFMTMELVPGRDLFADETPQTEAEVRGWLPGVAAALAYLHGRGYVHGDLKPENIRLREDGVPKLMDLGLMTRAGRAGGPIRGSLLYLAPEAIKQAAVDGRADLYGLGAVIYHVLAGRPPFEGDQALGLVQAHLAATPMPVSAIAPGVSAAMADAVMRLLAKEPAARFATVGAMSAALGLARSPEAATHLLGSPLVGREAAWAAISALIAEGGSLALVGEPGAGKSRLIAEARGAAQLAGLPVYALSGEGRDAGPYRAMRPIWRAMAAGRSAVTDRLAPVLAAVVPALAERAGGEAAPALEGAQARARLFDAVGAWLAETAPEAIVLIDDADQLDEASEALLNALMRIGPGPGWRWLRASAAPIDGALAIGPLSEADSLAVAEAMLGQPAPGAVARRLHGLAGGLPGLIEAALAHWVRTGALTAESGAWVAGPESAFAVAGGLRTARDAAFASLSPDAQALGRLAALLGATVPIQPLLALSGLGEAAFFDALRALEEAEVLAVEGPVARFVRLTEREALMAAWDPGSARDAHGRAGRYLAGTLGGSPDAPGADLQALVAVASHLLDSDAPAEGVRWALSAGRRALAVSAIAEAERLSTRALAVGGLGPAETLALTRLRVDAWRQLGRIDEALPLQAEHVVPALRRAADPALAGELTTLAIMHQMKGRYAEAQSGLAEAMALADAAGLDAESVRARLYAGRVCHFAGQAAAARAHLASAIARARRAGMPSHLARALALDGYLIASTSPQARAAGLRQLAEGIALHRAIGDLREAQEALNLLGNVEMAGGRYAEAARAFGECLAICERTGMDNETLFGHLNLAAVRLELGEPAVARDHAVTAVAMARRQARRFPEAFALAVEGLASLWLGEPATGLARTESALEVAEGLGNQYLLLNVLDYRAEALAWLGQAGPAREAIARARAIAEATENHEHDLKLDRLAAMLDLREKHPDSGRAIAALEQAATEADHRPALAHALGLAARHAAAADPARARATAERALALAEAEGLAGLWIELAGWLGDQAAAEGAAEAALGWYDRAIARAEAVGAVPTALSLTIARARVHGDGRSARSATARLEALGAALPAAARAGFWALFGRPEAQGDAGRWRRLGELVAAVGAQPDVAGATDMALRAMAELAGTDRAMLLLYEDMELVEQVVHGGDDAYDSFSGGVAFKVLFSGEPLYVHDVTTDGALADRASVQALSLRSVLGVPLEQDGTVFGVMLADSRQLLAPLGPDDVAFAAELGRQVAVLIGRARERERLAAAAEAATGLLAVAERLIGASTLEVAMAVAGREAIASTRTDRAVLLLGPALEPAAAVDASGAALSASTEAVSRSIAGWVLANAEAVWLLDAQAESAFQAQASVMALGLRTVVAAPVVHAGATHGVIYLDAQRVLERDDRALEGLCRLASLLGAFVARGKAPR